MAASNEQLTQQMIQLGNDLRAAEAKIKELTDKIARLDTAGGGRKTEDTIFDRTRMFLEPVKTGDA